MYLTTDSYTPFSSSPATTEVGELALKIPTRRRVMNIQHSHLLLQFSMANEVAELFAPPPNLTTCLLRDPLASRQERKSREGRDSHPLLVKQHSTHVKITIPDGFYLSNPWHQRREKLKNGRIEVYTMFRLSINRDDGRNGTHPEALAFLERLLEFRWATRGYINNLQHETQYFYSLNFEEVELATPVDPDTFESEHEPRSLFLLPSAEVVTTSIVAGGV